MEQLHYTQMIHESSSNPSQSHASFPIIAVAIIGIFATIFLLLFYYIFVIKCCHRFDFLRRFSVSRNRDHHLLRHHHHQSSPEPKGLHESVIRSIPIFQFQKISDSDHFTGENETESETECSVCLAEFQHNEKLRKIPNCSHVFHIDCIDVWLQNNPNCPLCRNSISISVSIPSHFPAPEIPNFTSPASDEQDYVVIELCGGDGGGDGGGGSTRRNAIAGEEDRPNSGEPVCKKQGRKLREKQGNILSMGDECIDVNNRRKSDEQFLIQPIRRSFSMDSASDRQLYLAVQEIIHKNSRNHVSLIEVNDESSSSNGRLRRGFFSFGHARSVVLPLNSKP